MDERLPELDKNVRHDISIVVDRLVMKEGMRRRLSDSVETALSRGGAGCSVDVFGPAAHTGRGGAPRPTATSGRPTTLMFSENLACPEDGVSLPEMAPRIFSFNSPHGACEACTGLGSRQEIDPELVVGDPDVSIAGGVLLPWSTALRSTTTRSSRPWRSGINVDVTALAILPKEVQDTFLYGTRGAPVRLLQQPPGLKRSYMTNFEGMVPESGPALPGDRLRLHAREDRGVHGRSAVPGLRGGSAAAPESGGDGRRTQHPRD